MEQRLAEQNQVHIKRLGVSYTVTIQRYNVTICAQVVKKAIKCPKILGSNIQQRI